MQPTDIRLHKKSGILELRYAKEMVHHLPAEFLRVLSPSAEVRGHGQGQEVLQTGKRHVLINTLEAIGHYGLKLHFSDGHNTGIYTWEYLYELGENQDPLWQDYLAKLKAAGAKREALAEGVQVVNIMPLNQPRGSAG